VKPDQFAEASSLTRRIRMNSVFTLVLVVGLGIATVAMSLRLEQSFVSRIGTGLTVVLATVNQ
jgi:magnesium-transporting ATPase (P-type)